MNVSFTSRLGEAVALKARGVYENYSQDSTSPNKDNICIMFSQGNLDHLITGLKKSDIPEPENMDTFIKENVTFPESNKATLKELEEALDKFRSHSHLADQADYANLAIARKFLIETSYALVAEI